MINYNKPRFTFDKGLLAYIPLPNDKGLVIYPIVRGGGNPFSIRSRSWALYDYADYGLKNYDLLVEMIAEVK